MKYISTRGNIKPIPFKDTLMMGLATDGGLMIPEKIPVISDDTLKEWETLPYPMLAFEVMRLFIDDIPENTLKNLVISSYKRFDTSEIAPLIQTGKLHILELFHGPTLAFKDIALQFLGELFSYILKKQNKKINILGATSGDTGSAAIYGVRGKENINIFILHPNNRVSPVQELQMTTVSDANVHNIAINGNFDDCQALVKTIFNDLDFKSNYGLTAINSINWARILAQVVYYIWCVLKLNKANKLPVFFSVPTGNFGDIFAGFIAKRMLGDKYISSLILATNENNILTRFIATGSYKKSAVVSTTSPSMDIMIASNFERYLYYLYDKNSDNLKKSFDIFDQTGELAVSPEMLDSVKKDFYSFSISQDEVSGIIKRYFDTYKYILDPHTAVGVGAMEQAINQYDLKGGFVCLSTAHPAKFPDAIFKAIDMNPPVPKAFQGLEKLSKRKHIMDIDIDAVKDFIVKNQ